MESGERERTREERRSEMKRQTAADRLEIEARIDMTINMVITPRCPHHRKSMFTDKMLKTCYPASDKR